MGAQDGLINAAQVVCGVQELFRNADETAEALLMTMLDAEQQKQFRESKWFEVTGQRGRYRITLGWAGNVFLIGPTGEAIEKLCLHPTVTVPHADNLITQKLLLETNEEEFLRIANRSIRSRRGDWVLLQRAA